MPKDNPFTEIRAEIKKDDGADNLVALVDYLQKMAQAKPIRSPWTKFDTRTTMSDNNGGLIKF